MDKRIVVITGTSKGLGRAMAVRFAALGHTVFGCSRNRQELKSLAEEVGKPHDFAVVDVSADGEVREWASRIIGAAGVPDLLINNAGVINRNAPLWQVSAEEFARVIDVNVKGTANTIRYFGPAMIREKKGVIVNFSSGWGRSTSPEVAPYCASKFAVEGLTHSLAEELPPPTSAVALSPGVVDTEMLRSCFGEEASSAVEPASWADKAVPYILRLSRRDNGRSLSVPN